MLRVEVNITDEGLRAALARVQGDLESTTEIHQAMAQGVEETVRGHLLTLNSRSPRTGFYGKAARSVESKWSAAEGLVTVPHRGVALRYYGGRVTMKDRLLALPTDAVPTRGDERVRPGEMQDLAFIPSRKRGGGTRGFLFEGEARPGKNGNTRIRRKDGGRLMYVLREWTEHRPDPSVMPDAATLTASASSAADDYLTAILQQGGFS